eukprot:7383128-Prymnesium_polylepis.1
MLPPLPQPWAALHGECAGPRLHFSERYVDVLRCGRSVLMLSRVMRVCEGGPNATGQEGWAALTLVRTQLAVGGFSPPRVLLPCEHPLSGSAWSPAFGCLREGVLVAFGTGEGYDRGKVRPGVMRYTVALDGSGTGRPELVLSAVWRESNCFEASNGTAVRHCSFDSKMTLVSWRGDVWLFVRAN